MARPEASRRPRDTEAVCDVARARAEGGCFSVGERSGRETLLRPEEGPSYREEGLLGRGVFLAANDVELPYVLRGEEPACARALSGGRAARREWRRVENGCRAF